MAKKSHEDIRQRMAALSKSGRQRSWFNKLDAKQRATVSKYIAAGRAENVSPAVIYRVLSDDGLVDCHETTFCRYVRSLKGT